MRFHSEGTKSIVVVLKSARKGFFRRDERRRDGGLIKRGPDPNVEFRNFTKGKKEFISNTFYKVDEAKAFAMDPNAESRRRKNRAAETAQQKERKTKEKDDRPEEPDCRQGRPAETFYRKKYEGSIYAHFPNLGEEATEDMKKWQSEFFKKIACDARKEVPSKNLYGKERNFDYLTYAFKVNKYNLAQDAKAALILAHHVFRQVYNATICFFKLRGEERFKAKERNQEPPPYYEKQELRELVYGLKGDIEPTPGMTNCAKHIPSNESLAVIARSVQESWKEVPARIREDALDQAWMAWKTNMQKVNKRRAGNKNAVIKPFNFSYRKFSQPSTRD
ncbi:unnamed protein product [Bathycoccus prasinos]